jgi:hypothetical protein
LLTRRILSAVPILLDKEGERVYRVYRDKEATVIMAKTRSPNYPAASLSDAIARTETIYRTEHRHPAAREVIARDLGYSGLNGASLPMLAALIHYGLLEKAGDGLRVSDDAVTVIEAPNDSAERAQVIRKLAFAPKLFEELGEAFGEQLPSDENLRLWLIRRDYNQNAVDKIIRVYRETLELVTAQGTRYNEPAMSEPKQETQKPTRSSYGPSPEIARLFGANIPPPAPLGESVLAFKISKDSEARIVFSGQVTQEAVAKLLALLELSKDTFPTQGELATKRAGVWRNKDVDQPVTVIGEAGSEDGRRYVKIEGSDTAIPDDEITYS